jgi:hypothetical protein
MSAGFSKAFVVPPLLHPAAWMRTDRGSTRFYSRNDFRMSRGLILDYGLPRDVLTPATKALHWYNLIHKTMPSPYAGNLPGVYVFAGHNGIGSNPGPQSASHTG